MLETPSLLTSREPADRDDIGYGLGWFCGFLVLGVVVAVIFLIQGRPRKAFQAAALSVGVLLGVILMLGLLPHGINENWIIAITVMVLAGGAFLPVLGVYVLRKLPWPRAGKATS